MTNNFFVYFIIAVVAAHFLFAIGYLVYKIRKAPKSTDDLSDRDNIEQNDSF